jgi:hypothetical protein
MFSTYFPGGAAAATRSGAVAPSAVGSVEGFARDYNREPVANAQVRLRDLATGLVAGETRASTRGEFKFADVPAGTYVVEVLDGRGRPVGVGNVITVGPGVTKGALVAASAGTAAARGAGKFSFGSAAIAATSAAASLGITALRNGADSGESNPGSGPSNNSGAREIFRPASAER